MLPTFARIAQKALNEDGDQDGQDMSDIEVGISMIELKDDQSQYPSILVHVKQICVRCTYHAEAVMMFAAVYGGHECSRLRFVDNVCKQLKSYEPLEDEVWWDLLNLEFSDNLIVYDFIRIALLLIFAVTNKRKLDDGSKKKFSSCASRANARACEQTLKEIWTL